MIHGPLFVARGEGFLFNVMKKNLSLGSDGFDKDHVCKIGMILTSSVEYKIPEEFGFLALYVDDAESGSIHHLMTVLEVAEFRNDLKTMLEAAIELTGTILDDPISYPSLQTLANQAGPVSWTLQERLEWGTAVEAKVVKKSKPKKPVE